MSFRFIEDYRKAYRVRLMCTLLDVSPTGRERPVSEPTKSRAALLAAIRQVHQDSCGRYGSPPRHKGKFPVVGLVKDAPGVAALYLGKQEGKELVYMGEVGTGWSRTISARLGSGSTPWSIRLGY
jgi:hypothetical protein